MKRIAKSRLSAVELELLGVARRSQRRAYAPESNYKVGAAVLDEHDNIHGGCNVENAAYKVTDAERSAISEMVNEGGTEIKLLAVATRDGGTPCGDCRQHVWQFCRGNKKMKILLIDKRQRVWQTSIGELLPYAFVLNK